MIHFVTGKPGSGKSFFGVRQLVEELRISERLVVTNLPLSIEALAEYVHKNIEKPVDLSKRLRVLMDSQVRRFWLHLPNYNVTKSVRAMGADSPEVPDFSEYGIKNPTGCLFIIDEVHLFFGARDWQKNGVDCQFFFSQHRHLKCDVMLLTQHPEKVDKNMRRDAQDFTVLRNMQSEPLFLGVRFKNLIRRGTFLAEPTRNDTPSETGFFKLDISGLCQLYDTSAGVGLVGRLDVTPKRKGRGLWVWGLAIAAALFLAWGIPRALGYLSGKAIRGFTGGISSTATKAAGVVSQGKVLPSQTNSVQTNFPQVSVKLQAPPDVSAATNRLYLKRVTMISSRPSSATWELSDGRILTLKSRGVSGAGEDFIEYNGERYEPNGATRYQDSVLPHWLREPQSNIISSGAITNAVEVKSMGQPETNAVPITPSKSNSVLLLTPKEK
jgi:hypothetical protein